MAKLASCLVALSISSAVQAYASPAQAGLEERVQSLSSELRCLVCQNQTVADSQAALALQLKAEVRRQLASGATDEAVRQFMVERYGDFVLYKPPLTPATWLLWLGPFLLFAAGGGWVWWFVRGQHQAESTPPS